MKKYPFTNGTLIDNDDMITIMPSGSFYFGTGTNTLTVGDIDEIEIKTIGVEKDKECEHCGNIYDLRFLDEIKRKTGFFKCIGCGNVL